MKRISPEDSKLIEDYINAICRLSNAALMEVDFWGFRDWLRNLFTLIKNRKVSKYSMISFPTGVQESSLERILSGNPV